MVNTEQKDRTRTIICLLLLMFCFSMCKSGGVTNPTPEEEALLEGILRDSEVQGVRYIAGEMEGVTDSKGRFDYPDGETVEFFIGGIKIGEATGADVITPVELATESGATIESEEVQNIAALLQSLDTDGNPENGITITETVSEAFTEIADTDAIDFTSTGFTDSLTTMVSELTEETGEDLSIVTPEEAAEHLAETLEDDNFVPYSVRDSLALVSIYHATGGANWTNSENWLSDNPVSEWYGVMVDENGRVVKLDLHANNLTGSIPSEIWELTALTYLNLGQFQGGNNLTGTIPAEIGHLENLEWLLLEENDLEGTIPPELGNLTHLKGIYLSSNQLTGTIPPEIFEMVQLQDLYLPGNQLTGEIPPAIANLTNLKGLYLNHNLFSGAIPAEIGSLVNLENLRLHENRFSGSIPPAIGNLTKLKILMLHRNYLTGIIPPEIGNLKELTQFSIGVYQGGDYQGTNQLSGGIPEELGNLVNLEWLMLEGVNLSGTIPAELGNLPNLRGLYLSSNNLTGSIPVTLGNLTKLTNLYLPGNQLEGEIPAELGNLTVLTELRLNHNFLTGDIPASLGNLVNLRRLLLHYNSDLTGSLPGNLCDVATLNISNTGIMPCSN